jgi:hypothetical protein
MLHPLLHLVATQPQLLADHAEAYAELVAAEIESVSGEWKRRAALNAAALCCLGVAAVLAGVALMLWAVVPAADIQAPWALLAAPAVPAIAAAICLTAARAPAGNAGGFDKLRQQLHADIVMLREAAGA